MQLSFDQAARLPEAGDNAALAIQRLEAGSHVIRGPRCVTLAHTVLEGHRFAWAPIPEGAPLLSWGLPFGMAARDIQPGEYLCNDRILVTLKEREIEAELPKEPNFNDFHQVYELDEDRFLAAEQLPRNAGESTFEGYARGGSRGVGTRNYIAVLGTTSWTAGYARALAQRFQDVPEAYPQIDGVIPVAHTEGGGANRPNNFDLLMRTLAGFMVHPNIGAILVVDYARQAVNNSLLKAFMEANAYPLDEVRHEFMSLSGDFTTDLAAGETVLRQWLEPVNRDERTAQSMAHLKIALQCGGSDAFSGVSGNPLAGWVVRELIQNGGSANLAETSELIGAEPYVLNKVKDLATARAFLNTINRFQEWAGWHGHSAEGNPSGGNLLRGLYNIAIKSIGAARKKDPEVRLDAVIDYSQPMTRPGFYFMDSAGNDLESIAGQVASGCNLILFTTGNGSITNFPFVPTIKIMTTSRRFQLLSKEMDLNAGRYLEGESMDALGADAFDLARQIASGRRSAGERAGHSQVQIWREWRQTERSGPLHPSRDTEPGGIPLPMEPASRPLRDERQQVRFQVFQSPHGAALEQIGLILPTSLCSGQIARLIVDRLNRRISETHNPDKNRIQRYVALAHTEGCGVSRGSSEALYVRTMVGYLCHPHTRRGLLLEHGCEKTHNDLMRHYLEQHGVDPHRFGWASVQLDGGIERVTDKVMRWFHSACSEEPEPDFREAGWEILRLGLTAVGPVDQNLAAGAGRWVRQIIDLGGTVVIAENADLLGSDAFWAELTGSGPAKWTPTLAYGQAITRPGLHVMEMPTDHPVETLTGLGAAGVNLLLALVNGPPLPAHPMVPLVQVGRSSPAPDAIEPANAPTDFDLLLPESQSPENVAHDLGSLIQRVLSRGYTPRSLALGNTDFQMTRGWVGVSL